MGVLGLEQLSFFFFNINLFIYLFIYFGLRWVFVAARRLSLVVVSGGFSCCGAQALGARASVAVAGRLSSCGSRALERRLRNCGSWAQLLHGMWDLPGPGPVCPALAGGVLTIAPPGKSSRAYLSTSFKFIPLNSLPPIPPAPSPW